MEILLKLLILFLYSQNSQQIAYERFLPALALLWPNEVCVCVCVTGVIVCEVCECVFEVCVCAFCMHFSGA